MDGFNLPDRFGMGLPNGVFHLVDLPVFGGCRRVFPRRGLSSEVARRILPRLWWRRGPGFASRGDTGDLCLRVAVGVFAPLLLCLL